jgi:biopolymer transport protein ExbB
MEIILLQNQTIETLKIIDLIRSGGVVCDIIMIVLGILSIFSIYYLSEKLIALKNTSKEDPEFIIQLNKLISEGDTNQALSLCENNNTPLSRMLEKGVTRLDSPLNEIYSSIENQGKLEVSILEKNLTNLATISGAAPMIGFLGTVIGMIIAFFNMSKAGGNIEVGILSEGIYTAMITTVAGLIVGIVSYISYNFLLSKIDNIVFELEKSTTKFIDNVHKISK